MKTYFNSRKIKFVARVMLLVLLLASALSFAGCAGYPTKKYILSTAVNSFSNSSQIQLMVTSDTKIYSKDNITLDLSYSMHSLNSNQESSLETRNDFYSYAIKEYDVSYGIYVTNVDIFNNGTHDYSLIANDLELIDNCFFVKQLSEEQALSEEYLRISPKFAIGKGADIYNHSELITIPKDYANKNEGTFFIYIIAFIWSEKQNVYDSFEESRIECKYKEIDENTIEIEMEDWKVYFRIP